MKHKNILIYFNIIELQHPWSSIFNYSLPTDLELSLYNVDSEISKILNFNLFFRRLNTLKCNTLSSLTYVPWEVLFNFNMDDTANNINKSHSHKKIEKLSIDCNVDVHETKEINDVNQVSTRLSKYINKKENDDSEPCIKVFDLKIRTVGVGPELSQHVRTIIKQLVLSFANISESICFNGSLEIKTMEELNTIFHKNLKTLHLVSDSTIDLQINNDKNNNHVNNLNSNDIDNTETVSNDNLTTSTSTSTLQICTCRLENIVMTSNGDNSDISMIHILNVLDKFSMRKNVKCYTICWLQGFRYYDGFELHFNDFDKIFFQDYDQHPLLETIMIKFKDSPNLAAFSILLMYFYKHYKQLFVERKLYLQKFQKIEIEFGGIETPIIMHYDGTFTVANETLRKYVGAKPGDYYVDWNKRIILAGDDYKGKKDYSIDKKSIQIQMNIMNKKVKPQVEQFVAIYQNVFKWLQGIQAQSSQDPKQCINGCKISLLVP